MAAETQLNYVDYGATNIIIMLVSPWDYIIL